MSTSEKLQWVILDTSRRGGLKAAGRSFAAARAGNVESKVKLRKMRVFVNVNADGHAGGRADRAARVDMFAP